MDDFASKQGVPNLFGLIQGPANAIAPGKRPLSPHDADHRAEGWQAALVLGSPGGGALSPRWPISFSVGEDGLNIQQAVDAPRFHHQYLPDKLYLEPGFPLGTIDGLGAWATPRQSRPLVGRRMHRGRSEDRRTAGWPGPPPSLWVGGRILRNRLEGSGMGSLRPESSFVTRCPGLQQLLSGDHLGAKADLSARPLRRRGERANRVDDLLDRRIMCFQMLLQFGKFDGERTVRSPASRANAQTHAPRRYSYPLHAGS